MRDSASQQSESVRFFPLKLGLFSLLLAFHFGARSEPFRDLAGCVLHGDRAHQLPAVTLVRSSSQPMLAFKNGPGFGCRLPGVPGSLAIVRMEQCFKAQTAGSLQTQSRILPPAPAVWA